MSNTSLTANQGTGCADLTREPISPGVVEQGRAAS
jgi:hypothetical protein